MVLIKDLEGEDYNMAVKYAEKNFIEFKPEITGLINDMKLECAFVFDDTEEGHKYWANLNIEIKKQK